VQDYRLEPARVTDAALLAAMSHRFVETGLAPAWSSARIRWHTRHPDSVVLTARVHLAPIGFAIMRYGEDVAHLNLLAVDPAHRRRGVARSLLRWLEATALVACGLLVNAFLYGAIAGPFPRYQSAVAWLATSMAAVGLVRWRLDRNRRRRSGSVDAVDVHV